VAHLATLAGAQPTTPAGAQTLDVFQLRPPDRQAALTGQGIALARMPLVADSLASGDSVEVLPGGRIDTPMVYWLLVGARNSSRPEIQAFCDWLLAQATVTRKAIGELPDPETQAHPD